MMFMLLGDPDRDPGRALARGASSGLAAFDSGGRGSRWRACSSSSCSSPVTGTSWSAALGPAIYVVSTLAVFVAVLRNIRLTGMPLVALGALSNLAAITANGGSCRPSPRRLPCAGLEAG